jgi:hypothetical protein
MIELTYLPFYSEKRDFTSGSTSLGNFTECGYDTVLGTRNVPVCAQDATRLAHVTTHRETSPRSVQMALSVYSESTTPS